MNTVLLPPLNVFLKRLQKSYATRAWIEAVIMGMSNKEYRAFSGVSEGTVESYSHKVAVELGLQNNHADHHVREAILLMRIKELEEICNKS